MALVRLLWSQLDLPVVLTTKQAASLINRQPQTLRRWACQKQGPIQPLRINGRLAWRADDVAALLQASATSGQPAT